MKANTPKPTKTIRSNEALSSGYIFNPTAKQEQSDNIQKQVDLFLKNGGVVTEH